MKTRPTVIVTVRYPGEFISTFQFDNTALESTKSILERVFEQWNHGSGRESNLFQRNKVRSLSVNDIVCIDGQDYQCKGTGWEKIPFQFTNDLENEVIKHPLYKEHGSWFALNDIMWEKKCKKKSLAA